MKIHEPRESQWAGWRVWTARLALVAILLGALVAYGQQRVVGFGGQQQMADLFKVFFSWDASNLTINGSRNLITGTANSQVCYGIGCTGGNMDGAGAGLRVRSNATTIASWNTGTGDYVHAIGFIRDTDTSVNGGFRSSAASGNNGFANETNGARIDFGAGASDYASSDGTIVTFAGPLTAGSSFTSTATATFQSLIVMQNDIRPQAGFSGLLDIGASTLTYRTAYIGYVVGGTPFTIDSVYVNTIPTASFIYGGGTLPAHPFTVQAIRFYVRTAGSGGTTNATFAITDGTNTCNCTYACNQSTGSKRATCAGGGGSGCAFPASAALGYSYSGVGDCAATSADINGNISVEGIWQ